MSQTHPFKWPSDLWVDSRAVLIWMRLQLHNALEEAGHCFQTLKITYDHLTDKWPACGRLNRDGFLSGTEAGTCGTLLRNRFDCSRSERPENSPTLKLHVRERSDGLFRNEKEMILSQVTVVCVKHAMPTERIWHPLIKKNTYNTQKHNFFLTNTV